jgi:hypothetical protein
MHDWRINKRFVCIAIPLIRTCVRFETWDLLTVSTRLLQAGKPTRKKSDFGVFRNNAFFSGSQSMGG